MIRILIAAMLLLLYGCAGNQTRNQIYQKYTTNGVETQYDGHCFNIWKSGGNDSLLIKECEKGGKLVSSVTEGLVAGFTLGLVTPDLGASAMVFVGAARNYLGAKCRVLNNMKIDEVVSGTAGYEIMYQC